MSEFILAVLISVPIIFIVFYFSKKSADKEVKLWEADDKFRDEYIKEITK